MKLINFVENGGESSQKHHNMSVLDKLIQFSFVNEWRALEKKGEKTVELSSDNMWVLKLNLIKPRNVSPVRGMEGECSEDCV